MNEFVLSLLGTERLKRLSSRLMATKSFIQLELSPAAYGSRDFTITSKIRVLPLFFVSLESQRYLYYAPVMCRSISVRFNLTKPNGYQAKSQFPNHILDARVTVTHIQIVRHQKSHLNSQKFRVLMYQTLDT